MRWKLAHPWWGSNVRSLDYIPSSITRHMSDHRRKVSQKYFYTSGSPNKEIVYVNDKNMNWICPMTAILNFAICGKTVSFTACHTAEMDSAQSFHIETTNEVLFLKNAYRSLSRAIFQCFVLTIRAITIISMLTAIYLILERRNSFAGKCGFHLNVWRNRKYTFPVF